MNRFRLQIISVIVLWLIGCNDNETLFKQIPSSHSGVEFKNRIVENDSLNPLDIVNIYNGGGVGIGDFDNNGLPDIYFSGNMESNRLYLNKGDFVFQDVTTESGVDGNSRWGRGVAVIDINNDGLHDIYVCNAIYNDSLRRRNLLYINTGSDKEGIPDFSEQAHDYGLDIALQSTMANFFDYDNDGDLDMYLTVNAASEEYNPNRFGGRESKTFEPSIGKLYRNETDPGKSHPAFKDVSKDAGITIEGFGHGSTIVDINQDGWKDIYVTNDFLSNNILYINNGNGTFTNKAKDYFKHTSYNAMGQDIVDINNDGFADIVELDMSPEDNYRKKMMLNSNNTTTDRNFQFYGYQYQYVRNTLQLNQGRRVGENDSIREPVFSEIGFMSGISQTDWSWAPVVTDFDNDGFRDIVVTNGFPKDVTDHDFIVYREEAFAKVSKNDIIRRIPQVKLQNYAFSNNGDLTFRNESNNWGLKERAFSNGAAYADFDNNGTLDLVVSNINDEALIYKNTALKEGDTAHHYLQVRFAGDGKNKEGIGSFVDIFYGKDRHQVYEHNPYRGYLSTMQSIAHFGLGTHSIVDSLVVRWPNGKKQTLKGVKANQQIEINITDANESYSWQESALGDNTLFYEVTSKSGVTYRHRDPEIIDFDIQVTLPHKLSEYCPALAVGDIDGNGLDDILVGGNSGYRAQVLLQQDNCKFVKSDLGGEIGSKISYKDGGILVFDANADGSADVYITSAGYRHEPNSENYRDRLYINDGKGNFRLAENALPDNFTSKLCVRAFDFSGDGKLDIFVSGRVHPWKYPVPVSSFLLRNDSENGNVRFTDVTDQVAPGLRNIGMVCDALFSDFDDDRQTDLILVGEWMPITYLKKSGEKFINVTPESGVGHLAGWWNSIVGGDFRGTGRTDYIVGNIGLNTLYQASEQHPVYITANDFDDNGSIESFISLFLPDQKGQLREFPANGRDDFLDRLPSMKKQYNDYRSFATATMDEIFPADKRKGAIRLKANILQSCFLRNDGGGKFTLLPLPKEAQTSSIAGMLADDFDGDGNLDVLMNGNYFGTEVSIGRYDALNGLLLKGDGEGGFLPLSIQESGIYIPGNGRAIVKLKSAAGNYLVAASQYNDGLKLFELNRELIALPVEESAISALITYKDGKKEKREFYYGTSFLSQSSRFIPLTKKMSKIVVTERNGKQKEIKL